MNINNNSNDVRLRDHLEIIIELQKELLLAKMASADKALELARSEAMSRALLLKEQMNGRISIIFGVFGVIMAIISLFYKK